MKMEQYGTVINKVEKWNQAVDSSMQVAICPRRISEKRSDLLIMGRKKYLVIPKWDMEAQCHVRSTTGTTTREAHGQAIGKSRYRWE